jgi:isoquinoline 1-oxidoreductase beta subunit
MERWPTAVKVLEKVADMSNWKTRADNKPDATRARGVAFTLSFRTWVAQVVQVRYSKTDKDPMPNVSIEKVWCAADVGRALDPDILVAQMESGIIFGLSAAMGQQITFADGMVEQSNFHDFDAMRMHEAPEIEVAILQNADQMGGAGEPGTPPAAPALANAIFAATGRRIYELPLCKMVNFIPREQHAS